MVIFDKFIFRRWRWRRWRSLSLARTLTLRFRENNFFLKNIFDHFFSVSRWGRKCEHYPIFERLLIHFSFIHPQRLSGVTFTLTFTLTMGLSPSLSLSSGIFTFVHIFPGITTFKGGERTAGLSGQSLLSLRHVIFHISQ